jgi:hypothetical protein
MISYAKAIDERALLYIKSSDCCFWLAMNVNGIFNAFFALFKSRHSDVRQSKNPISSFSRNFFSRKIISIFAFRRQVPLFHSKNNMKLSYKSVDDGARILLPRDLFLKAILVH